MTGEFDTNKMNVHVRDASWDDACWYSTPKFTINSRQAVAVQCVAKARYHLIPFLFVTEYGTEDLL